MTPQRAQNDIYAKKILCATCLAKYTAADGELLLQEMCVPCRETCIGNGIIEFTSEE